MAHATDIDGQLGAAVCQNSSRNLTGLLERLFARLFRGLVYAQIWEDPVVDMAALRIAPGENVVCIASGGCNAMSYLTAGPASVTAVDLSPAHVALVKLKAAGAGLLTSHAAFYEFFGDADRDENMWLYDQYIRPGLDQDTRDYWDQRAPFRRRVTMFSRGAYRFGLLGRFIGAAHLIAHLGGIRFTPLLQSRSIAEQKNYFERHIEPLLQSRLVRFLARRRAVLFGLGIPPAQYDKLAADGGGDVHFVLSERLRKLMCDFPIGQNYFAWQAFGRRYAPDAPRSVPPYLEPSAFQTLRDCAGRLEALNLNLTDHLVQRQDASCDCYVLLDAQDWMSDAQLGALWANITRTARPGARVIFRTGGAQDILPGRVAKAVLGRWAYDRQASAQGTASDRSAIYGGFHMYRFRG